jgi:hypothetical protein
MTTNIRINASDSEDTIIVDEISSLKDYPGYITSPLLSHEIENEKQEKPSSNKKRKQKTCEHPGCIKQPSFGMEGETRGRFCAEHKKEGMVNVKDKTCEHPGCKKQPAYANEGEKRGRFCVEHKEEGMVNVVNKRCEHPGCRKIPAYANEGEKRGRFCVEHKKEGMVNVKDKTCEHPGCRKIPAYANEGEKRGRFCVEHKEEGMVDVKHKTCKHPGCRTRPSRGLPGHPPTHCATHKQEGHIPYPKSKCSHPSCKEQALYTNKGGGTRPLRCETHKQDDDINCVERNCVSCGLLDILDHDGFCYSCKPSVFNTFRLAKQNAVVKFLSHIDYIPKPISVDAIATDSECDLKSRPDIVFLSETGTHYVIVEVDENQHKDRNESCECVRMVNIGEAFMKPTFFIRYNPDDFKVNRKRQKITDNARRKILAEHLNFALKYTPEKIAEFMKNGGVFMKQLFFDGFNNAKCEWVTVR